MERCRLPASMVLTVLLLAGGCHSGPVAPVLSDSRIYQNASEGFRLLVPEGWNQTASSVLPPGLLKGEIFLTRYSLTTPDAGASFQVLCMDDGGKLDLEGHHAAPSFGVDIWTPTKKRESVSIGGEAAERFAYQGQLSGSVMHKYVTSFRRNDRAYSFVGVCRATDEIARQQIERATADIIWVQ